MATREDVQDLFTHMLVRYGSVWLSRFDQVPIEAVKQDWTETLHDLGKSALAYGVANLPPKFPPDAMQFRLICLSGPQDPRNQPRIAHQEKVNPEGRRRLAKLLQRVVDLQRKRSPRQWIEDLRSIPERDRTPAQIQSLRNLEEIPADSCDIPDLQKRQAETARRVRDYMDRHR